MASPTGRSEMKLFNVEVSYIAVVVAENEIDAHQVALDFKDEIASDAMWPSISVGREVKSKSDLEDGWEGDCIPYGGHDDKRLDQINPELAK